MIDMDARSAVNCRTVSTTQRVGSDDTVYSAQDNNASDYDAKNSADTRQSIRVGLKGS